MPESEKYKLFQENELFVRIAQGDEVAFRLVFNHYSKELAPFIIKLTDSPELAREVVQDIFLQLWEQRQKLISIENPRGWIIRLASNTAIDYLRKRAANGRLFERLKLQKRTAETPEATFAVKELETRLEHAVNLLPPARQKVYRLSREHHLTIPEIAASTGVSVNTVKNQLVAALKAIRRQLVESSFVLIYAGTAFINFF